MVRRRKRLNPSDPDFQLQYLVTEVQDLKAENRRLQADSHTGTEDPGGITDSITIDPDDSDILVISSTMNDEESEVILIPTSTLMVLDPNDPDIMTFPFLPA